MDRRLFLHRAALAVAAMAIDPELLVWKPKAMITVPAMPTLTLVDWARRMDPNRKVEQIIELLSQSNELLDELIWKSADVARLRA